MRWRRKSKPLQATPSPAFLRAWLGHTERFAVNLGLAPTALEQLGRDFDAVEWDWPRWGRRILVSRNRPRPWLRYDGTPLSAFVPPGYHVEAGWKPRNGEYVEPGEVVPIYPMPETQKLRDWPNG